MQNNKLHIIVLKPRRAVHSLLEASSSLLIELLIIGGSIYYSINQLEISNLADNSDMFEILLNTSIGSLVGFLSFKILAYGISVSCKWIGGKGNFRSTQAVIAYSMIPFIIGLGIVTIALFLFGQELFMSKIERIRNSPGLTVLFWVYVMLKYLISIWALVLIIVLISEVQGFSIIKSIVGIILGFIIVCIPLFIIQFINHPELWMFT